MSSEGYDVVVNLGNNKFVFPFFLVLFSTLEIEKKNKVEAVKYLFYL